MAMKMRLRTGAWKWNMMRINATKLQAIQSDRHVPKRLFVPLRPAAQSVPAGGHGDLPLLQYGRIAGDGERRVDPPDGRDPENDWRSCDTTG